MNRNRVSDSNGIHTTTITHTTSSHVAVALSVRGTSIMLIEAHELVVNTSTSSIMMMMVVVLTVTAVLAYTGTSIG